MSRGWPCGVVGVCRLCAIVLVGFATLLPLTASASDGPNVTAQYAVVVDADTGEVLYDKSMNTPTAPASLTKIFTAAVALDSAPLDRELTVDAYDLVGEASMGLQAGDRVTLEAALYGMMLPSGNDAAMTIARNLGALPGDTPQQSVARFMERVQRLNQRLGLTGTHLLNPHGLDQDGHETTARDLAAITMYALKNPEFRAIIGAEYYNADGRELYQANRMLQTYPGLIGGKTGITDRAGYCLVEVARRDGHTVIAVVLKSTHDAWYQDAESLLDYGFQTLAARPTDAARPRITLGPEAPSSVPAVVATPAGTATGLSVSKLDDSTAIVSSATAAPARDGMSWRWPIASVASMLAMLALALNYPIVLALVGLLVKGVRKPSVPLADSVATLPRAVRRHPAGRRRRGRRRRGAQAANGLYASGALIPQPPGWAPEAPGRFDEPGTVVPLNAAETIAGRAVRLALRGDYEAATSEFARALEREPGFDLTRSADFWSMQLAGYAAAARAYLRLDRPGDARSLLTVVKLSYGTNRELESLLAETVALAR